METALQTALQVAAPPRPLLAGQRNSAVDAYRGLVMLLMMAEVLQFPALARAAPGNGLLKFLAYHQTHVDWAGCSLHDTIQPGFSFLVGVALPYSIASRIAKGGSFWRMLGHALWRSLALAALGIFLRSTSSRITNFTFEDTLTQIGLGYPFLFLLGFCRARWQWAALMLILVGYWAAWALYPVAPPGPNAYFAGFAAHWNKNANLGHAFDLWFLNLFPRPRPFTGNAGGYLTLSFVPTLGTMILGLAAGQWLREAAPRVPMRKLLAAGVLGIAAGGVLHYTGICPVVKRIWTPSWTLFSGGLCFLFLAAFSWLMEVRGWRKWAFPLVVIGVNSIAAYLIAHLWQGFIISALKINLRMTAVYLVGPSVLICYWLILFWMYRRRVFVRI